MSSTAEIAAGKAADTGQSFAVRGRLDGRSKDARRLRQLADALARDLGHAPTASDIMLIGTAAQLTLRREAMLVEMANGTPVDADLVKISGAIGRTLRQLGIDSGRGRKPVGPAHVPLREQLAIEAAEAAEREGVDD